MFRLYSRGIGDSLIFTITLYFTKAGLAPMSSVSWVSSHSALSSRLGVILLLGKLFFPIDLRFLNVCPLVNVMESEIGSTYSTCSTRPDLFRKEIPTWKVYRTWCMSFSFWTETRQ